MSTKKTPEQTEEEKDEELLRELDARFADVTELMTRRLQRHEVDEKLLRAREHAGKHKGNKTSAFHKAPAGHVATTEETRANLDLVETLRHRIRLGAHAANLQDALHRISERQVQVLERQLKRAKY